METIQLKSSSEFKGKNKGYESTYKFYGEDGNLYRINSEDWVKLSVDIWRQDTCRWNDFIAGTWHYWS